MEQLGGAFGESGLLVLPWRIRLVMSHPYFVFFFIFSSLLLLT